MYKNILSTGKIGSLKLCNRFVVPPMGTAKGTTDGYATDNLVAYYAERAKGGYGLIIVELAYVDAKGKAIPEQLGLDDDKFIPSVKRIADAIHKTDSKAFIQIHHAGRQTMPAIIGTQPEAPSPIPCPSMRNLPREMSSAEIYQMIEKFGDAAERAKKAGFDGVEVHGAHGYLVGAFMSACSNTRSDEFGGSLVNRTRFATEIIKNIRKKCSDSFPISVRISGNEHVPGGLTTQESAAIAGLLEQAGADAIHVSVGNYGSMPYIIAPASVPQGFNLADIKVIKDAVKIPIIAVGKLYDPNIAEMALKDNIADFISVGRGSIADPYLPNKIKENRIDELLPCVGCMTRCQGVVADSGADERGVSCMVNPFAGFEDTRSIQKARVIKKVVVVGGGPAGLEAAWVSAARGHKVTLFEKGDKLGGQFIPAAVPSGKQEIIKSIAYYHNMCKKYGVDIKLNTEATVELITALKPDEVILATGALPVECDIPIKDIPVVQAIDLLLGKVLAGNNVLVVGGGMVGLETADFLTSQKRKVTVVEMQDAIGKDLHPSTLYFLMKSLHHNGVRIMADTKVNEINAGGAVCINVGNVVDLKGFDMVVLAIGARSYNPLEAQLKDKVKCLHVIGDAREPRKGVEAIDEGLKIALSI